MGFKLGDPNINRAGRPLTRLRITAVFEDLAVEFPDLAPHEAALLRVAAALLYRGEKCRDSAVAHRCVTEARKIIAGLQVRRAAALKAKPVAHVPIRDELAAELEQAGGREPMERQQ
jgi:hypothetical protein